MESLTVPEATPTGDVDGIAPAVVAAPADPRRRLLGEAAWALGAALVSMIVAVWALGVTTTNIGQRWTTGSDDQILHYTLFTSATQAFPFATNQNLGFPHGLNAFFSAQFDVSSALVVSLLARLTDNGFLLLNVFYVLTFAGVAVTGYMFFRALRVRPWISALVAVVFSLAPYHFWRLEAGHAFLANYWAIPLIGILVLVVAGERTDPFRAWATRAPTLRGRRLRRGVPIVCLALAVASSGGYYYVFGVIVVGGVWLLACLSSVLSRHPLRRLTWPTVAILSLGVFVGIELLVLSLGFGERYAPYFAGRSDVESELYAGRLTPLLLPWQGTGLPWLGTLTADYTKGSLTSRTTEPPGLPFVASIALVALIVVLPVLALAGGSRLRATAVGRLVADRRVRVLATANCGPCRSTLSPVSASPSRSSPGRPFVRGPGCRSSWPCSPSASWRSFWTGFRPGSVCAGSCPECWSSSCCSTRCLALPGRHRYGRPRTRRCRRSCPLPTHDCRTDAVSSSCPSRAFRTAVAGTPCGTMTKPCRTCTHPPVT